MHKRILLFIFTMLVTGIFFSQALFALAEVCMVVYFLVVLAKKANWDWFKSDEGKDFKAILVMNFTTMYGMLISSNLLNGWKMGKSSLHIILIPLVNYVVKKVSFDKCWMIFKFVFLVECMFAVYFVIQRGELNTRVHGILYYGTDGLFASIIFIFIIFRIAHLKVQRSDIFVVILAFIFVVLSQSRAPFLTMILLTPLCILKSKIKLKALICFVMLLLLMFMLPDKYHKYMTDVLKTAKTEISEPEKMSSIGGRIELWKATIMSVKQTKGVGTGYGDYLHDLNKMIKDGSIHPIQNTMHAHNIFLHPLMCAGIIGFIGVCYLLTRLFWNQWKKDSLMLKFRCILILHLILTGLFDAHFEHSKKILFYALFWALCEVMVKPPVEKSEKELC